MSTILNVGIDGVAYGMVLFVIAVGMSVTLGLMRFVNLAHGAFAMVGGYAAAWLTRDVGWSFGWLCRWPCWPPAPWERCWRCWCCATCIAARN